MNRTIQDATKSYSQVYEAHHTTTSSQQSQSSSTLSHHLFKQRNDDDVLPPPPPEAYSDSENQHIHPSNTKINCSRREFLQTLNAKLSVFQNQRLSPKLVKRRSMSLPHSDQEWDSDSGITSQSTSSNKSSPRGSTSSHSDSFTQSLTERLGTYGNRNSNNYHLDGNKSRNSGCHKNQNTSNSSHSTYASFLYNELDPKNVTQNFGYSDSDMNDHSLSKIKLNSSQHSEVAKAAATEAIRRKKSQSECSLEVNLREGSSQIKNSECTVQTTSENASSNCMDRIYRSHQHYLSHYNHQHHPSNPFHQNYPGENMQNENIYSTRNQSVYQSTSNPTSACFSEPLPNNFQQKSLSQPAMYAVSKNHQMSIGHQISSSNYNCGSGVDSSQTSTDNNLIYRDRMETIVRSEPSREYQHIHENSGDIISGVDESNRACSDGSITPTNPDRNSPTYESSKSTVLSYIKREPVHLSALKSTKSYPGSHLAESLYSSTGTLSRLGKPAPPPPVRKTSSISDPNAITLGTLRSAGVSTYEEIKTLKRNARNRSGGSSFNTYEELNSDKNAIYYAARKSCLSTSLTSLVEPIYSTLDSNNTGTANPYDAKIDTVNNLPNQNVSKSYSQVYDTSHHCTSSQQSQSSSTLSKPPFKQRNDDDVLPPPPPEAYSDSENQHIHPSNTKINCSRREFLQTLNAKLSVFQNQRLSPKLVKRRSMSLPHSDQEWDSDSGITSQSTSSNKSSPRGSTSSHSDSFTQSLVKRLSAYGGRNNNNNSFNTANHSESSKSRTHGNNQNNLNNYSHSIYSSFFFGRNKPGESDSKNVPQNYEHGDIDDYSLSKIKLNSNQHSEVAKAAATEAIRRKKSQSECSLEVNPREGSSQIKNPESHQSSAMQTTTSENSSSNCMDRIYRSHQHYLSHYNHQHHPSNPFHQNYPGENMQNENIYSTRNQSVYQSTSNQPNAYLPGPYSGSQANQQQKPYSQTAMYTALDSYSNNNEFNPRKGPNKNSITCNQLDTESKVSSSSVQESQHIHENSGDIISGVDESNRACSDGSITPTNPDRNSPTYESSKSTVLSYIKREPVHLSALKSTKSYPGSHLAESLYSSTGTLSRLGKPAPPPPVRKTSSISDPNAITLGTLRSAGVSTYEEIKTLKRNARNRSGGSSFNTYEELNSDKNAIYYAARKSCLSTSLTSLVEPIYSTLDSNNTGTANPYDSKTVAVNSMQNQDNQDASKSYSQIHDSKQHPTSSMAFTVF